MLHKASPPPSSRFTWNQENPHRRLCLCGKGSNGTSNHNTRTKEGGEGERGTKRNWTSWNDPKALRQELTSLLNKERQVQSSSTSIQTSLSPERVRFWRKQLSDHHRVQFKIIKDGAKEAPDKSRTLAISKTDKARLRGQLSNKTRSRKQKRLRKDYTVR